MSSNCRDLRASIGAAALLLAGCASDPPEESREPTPVERKQTLLHAADRAIHVVVEDARSDLARIGNEFDAEVAAAPLCFALAAAEPGLARFGEPERAARIERVEAAAHRRKQRLELLLEHYETALWAVAIAGGEQERGDALGSRSGYVELDRKVEAALLQLARDVDVDGAVQDSEAASRDHVALERQIRHELPGFGVFSLYKSSPVRDLLGREDEGQAAAVVFVRARPDSIAPDPRHAAFASLPLSFVQAVRHHVERGGLTQTRTEWRLEPAATDARGTLPLEPGVDPALHLASGLCVPRVQKGDPSFPSLADHLLVAEYRTALRRDDTGELLVTIGWQVRWNIDFKGRMRVLVDSDDQVLEDDPVLPRLLSAPTADG